MIASGSILTRLPPLDTAEEAVDCLLATRGVKIERIVSTGQASPPGFWYDQSDGEWVLLVAGAAKLMIEGEALARELGPGDWLELPPRCRHRVEWTAPDRQTVWLAVRYPAGQTPMPARAGQKGGCR